MFLIFKKVDGDCDLLLLLNVYDEVDVEFKCFIEKMIEEIDKYCCMDEWILFYQNIWMIVVLECKM